MARKKEEAPAGAPEWMTTYSDLVTLLLTFFILLFSMASIDKIKFEQVAASLQNTVLNLNTGQSLLSSNGKSVISVDLTKNSQDISIIKEKNIQTAEKMIVDAKEKIEAQKIDQAKEQIRETIKKEGLTDKVSVFEEKEFLLVRFESEVFFDSGRADLRNESIKVLNAVAKSLQTIENEIFISGHTDNIPISNTYFKSNWELSTARATNVVVYLVNNLSFDPKKITATGNGEFRPIADNVTAAGRQMNRRIEIKIMK